jgi:hypothetical protein
VQTIIHYTTAICSLAQDFKECGEKYEKSMYQQGYKAADGLPEECQQLQFALLHATDAEILTLSYVESKLLAMYKAIEAKRGNDSPNQPAAAMVSATTSKPWTCYRCGKPGHRVAECKNSPRKGWDESRFTSKRGTQGRNSVSRGGANGVGDVAQLFAMVHALSTTTSIENGTGDWIMDCAVSAGHITIHRQLFSTYTETPKDDRRRINPFGGGGVEVEGYGEVSLPLKSGNIALLKEVAYVPGGSANLISTDTVIHTMARGGTLVNYMQGLTTSKIIDIKTTKSIITATRRNGLHYLDIDKEALEEAMKTSEHDLTQSPSYLH